MTRSRADQQIKNLIIDTVFTKTMPLQMQGTQSIMVENHENLLIKQNFIAVTAIVKEKNSMNIISAFKSNIKNYFIDPL